MRTVYLKDGITLTEALKNAKKGDRIILEARTYYEKIVINVPDLTIEGQRGSEIVFGDYANKIHSDGLQFNTFRTYTVNVLSKNVTFKNLTIENDVYDPKSKGQAVALSVLGDGFFAENVTLKSAQDTLFLGPLPDDLIFRYTHFLNDDERYIEGEVHSCFQNCSIFGSVDYVFGCGTAFFEGCSFTNIDDGRTVGYVAAPSHSLKQKDGFTFLNCKFDCVENLDATVYLARPWRDYGKCTFISCKFGKHISPKAFDRWSKSYRNQTSRFELYDCKTQNPISFTKYPDGMYISALLSRMNKLKRTLDE